MQTTRLKRLRAMCSASWIRTKKQRKYIKKELSKIPKAGRCIANTVNCFGASRISLPLNNGKKEYNRILLTATIIIMHANIIIYLPINYGRSFLAKYLSISNRLPQEQLK